jgi:hypothetical protein
MRRSQLNWARTFARRGLVSATLVLALATYGLVTAGTQSLAFKPTASSGNSTDGRSVSQAVSPTNGSLNVATQGPNHSLYFFWNVAGKWYGPLGIGAPGSTWSAPTIVAETGPNAGNFDIAVEGPNHTLWFYWDISGTWYGPYQVGGPSTTYSTPGLAEDSSNNLQIPVEGPGNSLYLFWNVNAVFYGPIGLGGAGSTFSGPDVGYGISVGGSNFYIVTQGANNDVEQYSRLSNVWQPARAIANDGSAFSAPTLFPYTFRASFQGPNHSLWDAEGGTRTHLAVQIQGAGSTYSMPSEVNTIQDTGPYNRAMVTEGPSNSLWYYHGNSSNSALVVTQIGAPGSTFSAPNIVIEYNNNNNKDIAVQGPSNTLYAYFVISGTVYGPLQVGGPGTSFSSSN